MPTVSASPAARVAAPVDCVSRRVVLQACAAVFLLVVLSHAAVFRAEFVWDDLQIAADDYIHRSANWADVLTFRTLERDVIDNNRPAMLLSLMADATLYGRNPIGYHATNVLLHAANAALVCYLALELLFAVKAPKGLAAPGSWIVASAVAASLLFALHPVLVEAVSVVAFREDPQATFFVLASLAFVMRIDGPGGTRRRARLVAAALLSVLLAIGSKESAFVAPLVLLAYASTRSRTVAPAGNTAAVWSAVAGAAVIVALFLLARFAFRPAVSEVFTGEPRRIADSFGGWVVAQSRINAFHLERVFRFGRISTDYTPASLNHIPPMLAVALNVVCLVLVGWIATRGRLMLIGAVLIVGGMAAVSNLAPLYNPIADRYLYLPLAGAALVLAQVLARLGATFVRRLALGIVLGAAMGVVAAHGIARQRVFHDDVTLWTDALEKTPESYIAGNLRGWGLYGRGEFAGALASFEIALKNSGGQEPDSWAAGALCCQAMGDAAEAERSYRQAVSIAPLFRNPRLIKRAFLWRDEYIANLAKIARPTGLWIEPVAATTTVNEAR